MAQLVARLVRNEKVGGSNPPSSTGGRPSARTRVLTGGLPHVAERSSSGVPAAPRRGSRDLDGTDDVGDRQLVHGRLQRTRGRCGVQVEARAPARPGRRAQLPGPGVPPHVGDTRRPRSPTRRLRSRAMRGRGKQPHRAPGEAGVVGMRGRYGAAGRRARRVLGLLAHPSHRARRRHRRDWCDAREAARRGRPPTASRWPPLPPRARRRPPPSGEGLRGAASPPGGQGQVTGSPRTSTTVPDGTPEQASRTSCVTAPTVLKNTIEPMIVRTSTIAPTMMPASARPFL